MGHSGPITLFDLVGGLVLAASALAGFARGATREVTTVAAFIIAALLAFLALRFTEPIFAEAIHIAWVAGAAALVSGFIFLYIILRLLAGALTRRVRDTPALSGPDRFLGLLIGLVRGLIVIGAFALVLDAATPVERRPDWVTRAKLYPAAHFVAGWMAKLAPKRWRPDQRPGYAPPVIRREPALSNAP
ncbi:MAG TPA: CvpA family protein [Caulobacteraceae bacterium]|nr:CvpA family protein [Caulobacteraceae bacterium]